MNRTDLDNHITGHYGEDQWVTDSDIREKMLVATMRRAPIADRETGALKRIAAVCQELGAHWFHQTDPRGCALYVSAEPLTDSDYNRGVAI